MKINNINHINKEVVTTTVVRTTKKEILNVIGNKYYCNILYLILTKNFTYRSELDKLFAVNNTHYLGYLLRFGFIEQFNLNETQIKCLRLLNNLGDIHVERLTTYKLTNESMVILQNPLYYDLLCESLERHIIDYKTKTINKYNKKMEEIKSKQEFEEKQKLLRYKIAKMKAYSLRNAEDQAIIQEFDNL